MTATSDVVATTTTATSNGTGNGIVEKQLFREGAGVWIPDIELGWIGGDVIEHLETTPDTVLIRTEDDRELKVPIGKVFQKNPDILEGVDDLSFLSHLHEPAILHNLHHRYNLNQIYTYIGKILIAINPYTSLPLYGKEMISAYYGKQLGTLAPHVYAVAEDAFKDMRYDGTSQSILVSGESGAGKTETTKFLLQYFAAMGNMIKESTASHGHSSSSSVPSINISSEGITPPSPLKKTSATSDKSVEERVLESTPLLEAFGNAKTLRNDNSSRFGKFIEIHFNEFGSIIGAKILTYLLEKSRIVRQVYNERNYHIFYQLISGASEELKEKLNLMSIEDYNYLNKSGCFEIEGVSDEDHFNKTCHAMQVAGITSIEQENIFRILSAVLLIGNFEFENKDGANDDSCVLVNRDPLEKASILLGCSTPDELLNSMLTRKVVTGKESYISQNTKERAENSRDSLSMFLYGMMFDWLVVKINSSMIITQKSKSFIGVLDIYGFESFEVNGFEQFCINYANEKLQQLFNQHVFKEEQQEYIKEKIDWSYIDFADNQDTLDLIEKKPICILTLLDEETMFPKATAQTLATKLYSKMTSHSKFEKPRFSSTAFTINHYAGKVTYETDSFLDKNKDFIIPEQISILKNSSFSFIKTLLTHSDKFSNTGGPNNTGGGPKPSNQSNAGSSSSSMKFLSVGSQFSTSLATLMKTISTTTPHYVRCIKPNPEKLPQTFNKPEVIHQLRCGGVMESVRICAQGLPTRRLLSEFYQRYKILAASKGGVKKIGGSGKIKDPRILVSNLLQSIELSEDRYKIGVTKVFLRAGQLASLEDMRLEQLNHSATVIQKTWKSWYYRKRFVALREASISIQTKIRSIGAKLHCSQLQRNHSALLIQKVWRAYRCREYYRRLRESTILLQTVIRKQLDQQLVQNERCEHAAILLQTRIRQTMAKVEIDKKFRGIIALQAKWRGKMARKEYIVLRAEARSLRTVQEQKNKLQEKLEELQWRLTSEAKRKQQLEDQKVKQDSRIDELSNENDHLTLTISELTLKFNQLQESNQLVVLELSDSKQLSQEQSNTIDQSNKLNRKLEKDLSELQDQSTDLTAKYQELESIKNSTSTQLDEITLKFTKINQQFEFKQQEYSTLVQERENENSISLAEIQQLKKQLSTCQDDYFSLSGIKDTLERSLIEQSEEHQLTKDKLEKLMSDSSSSTMELTIENQKVQSQLSESNNQIKLLSDKIDQLNLNDQNKSNAFTLESDTFKKQIQQLELEINNQKDKFNTLTTTNENIISKAKKLKSKFDSVQEEKKLQTLELTQIKQLKQQLEDEKNQLTNQISTIKLESSATSTNISHQKDKIQSLKSVIDELNKSANKSMNDLRGKDDELRRLTGEISDLKNNSNKQSKELIDLQSQHSMDKQKSEISIHTLEESLKSLKSEFERCQQSLKQSERDTIQYRDTISRLENEVKQLQLLKERFENEFFVAKEQNSTSTQESAYLKEVTSQMNLNQSRLEKELEEKKLQIQRQDDEKDELKKQLSTVSSAHEQSSTQLLLATTELDRLRIKETKYKKRGHDNQQQHDELNLEIQKLTHSNQDHLRAIQDLESEKKKLKDKLQSYKSDSITSRESLIKMEAELSSNKSHSQWVENSFTDMKLRNQELADSNSLYKQQLIQVNSTIDQSIKQKEQEISQLSNQLSLESGKFEMLSKEFAELKELNEIKLRDKHDQIVGLQSTISTLQTEQQDLSNQLNKVLAENDKISSSYKEQEIKSKRMSVELQQSLDEGKQQELSNLQSTISQLKQQLSTGENQWKIEKYNLEKELNANRKERELQLKTVESTRISNQLLQDRLENYGHVMEMIDFKETEWEKLARLAGCKELDTKLLSDYLLSCKLEHTSLGSQMWFHQIDYWCPQQKESSIGIFHGIIRSIIDFTIKNFDDLDLLAYLLACCSLTLFLYQKDLQKLLLNSSSIMPTIPTISDMDELNDQLTSSPNRQIDFIDHLQRSTGRTFGLIFKVATNKLGPLVEGSILNENYNKKLATISASSSMFGNGSGSNGGSTGSSGVTSPTLLPLDLITTFLSSIISIFQHRMVHFTLSQRLFNQIFCWVGALIMKGFMLRSAFCSESFAIFVKQKIDQLVRWADDIGNVWVGDVGNAFTQVREVINVLTLKDKEKITDEKIRKATCPTLNSNQLKQILSLFNPGEFGKRVPPKVIAAICPPSKTNAGQSFVQDENKLNPIPINSLHYLEIQDIKTLTLPSSIRQSIETEILNLKQQIAKNNIY